MHRYIDNLMAFRVLYLLVQPFDKTDAFKLGIIDKDGKLLIPVAEFKTDEQKDAYNFLVRLVFNLKRLIAKIPGGSTRIGSFVAAYFLIKEGVENGNLNNLEEKFESLNNQINEGLMLVEETILIEKFFMLIAEDGEGVAPSAPVNNTAAVGNMKRDNPMMLKRRNNWKDVSKTFGVPTYEVSQKAYDGIKSAKTKGSRWNSHLPESPEDSEAYDKIKGHSAARPKDPIAIKRKDHEQYQFIKTPGQ